MCRTWTRGWADSGGQCGGSRGGRGWVACVDAVRGHAGGTRGHAGARGVCMCVCVCVGLRSCKALSTVGEAPHTIHRFRESRVPTSYDGDGVLATRNGGHHLRSIRAACRCLEVGPSASGFRPGTTHW